MNINNGVMVTKGDIPIPIEEIINITVDIKYFVIALIAVAIILFLLKKGYELLQIKMKHDSYIDGRIDGKLYPVITEMSAIKQEQEVIKAEQAITRDDINDIKLQMVEMNTSLKFIAEIIRDFRQDLHNKKGI